MKYRKIMLVTFVLLAILTLGAVSASEDIALDDELTADAMDEVSVDASYDDEIISEEGGDSLASSDDASALEVSGDDFNIDYQTHEAISKQEDEVLHVEWGDLDDAGTLRLKIYDNSNPGADPIFDDGGYEIDGADECSWTVSDLFSDYDYAVGHYTIALLYDDDAVWGGQFQLTYCNIEEYRDGDVFLDYPFDVIRIYERTENLEVYVDDELVSDNPRQYDDGPTALNLADLGITSQGLYNILIKAIDEDNTLVEEFEMTLNVIEHDENEWIVFTNYESIHEFDENDPVMYIYCPASWNPDEVTIFAEGKESFCKDFVAGGMVPVTLSDLGIDENGDYRIHIDVFDDVVDPVDLNVWHFGDGEEEDDDDWILDYNSDLITFRHLVMLSDRYDSGRLEITDSNGNLLFTRTVDDSWLNYDMMGYKYDQYRGYVVFKEDLNNTETGVYDLTITYYDDEGEIVESADTTVCLDYDSYVTDEEIDISDYNSTLFSIHVFEVMNDGHFEIELTVGDDEDEYPYVSHDIEVNDEMIGQTLDITRQNYDLPEGEYDVRVRFVSNDDDPHDHYVEYWKYSYFHDSVTIVDNTKFRVRMESESFLDENSQFLVYCPENYVGQTITIEIASDDGSYSIDCEIPESGYNYFTLDDLLIAAPGPYVFNVYDEDGESLLSEPYEYEIGNPLVIREICVLGSDDLERSPVAVIYMDKTDKNIRLVLADEDGTELFNESLDDTYYDTYERDGGYFILYSHLDNLSAGTYALTASYYCDGILRLTTSSEIRVVERRIANESGISIELYNYYDHDLGDDEDSVAHVAIPGHDGGYVEVVLTDEDENIIDTFIFDEIDDDDGVPVICVSLFDKCFDDGRYLVTVTYFDEDDTPLLNLSDWMNFYREEEYDILDWIEFYVLEDDGGQSVFEIGDSVHVASLLIPENDEHVDSGVTITITINDEPFDVVCSSDIEFTHHENMGAYEYPICLDLTQLEDKDLLKFNVDCFDENGRVWSYAIEINGDNAIFHDYAEILDYYVFYGNATIGDLNDPELMGPHPDGDFIRFSVPGTYDISEGSIVISDNNGIIRSYILAEITDVRYNYDVLGNGYIISLDDFDPNTLPENETVTVTLTAGNDTITQKRIRIGDYVYKILTPVDFTYNPWSNYNFEVEDEVYKKDNDAVVFFGNSNRQSIEIDFGGGYFSVYVNDTRIDDLGYVLRQAWRNSDAYDEGYDNEEVWGDKLYLVNLRGSSGSLNEFHLSLVDLGINESGTYNIRITHIPDGYGPDDEPYIYYNETEIVNKDITYNPDGAVVEILPESKYANGMPFLFSFKLGDNVISQSNRILIYLNGELAFNGTTLYFEEGPGLVYLWEVSSGELSEEVSDEYGFLDAGEYEAFVYLVKGEDATPIEIGSGNLTVLKQKGDMNFSIGTKYDDEDKHTVIYADIPEGDWSGYSLEIVIGDSEKIVPDEDDWFSRWYDEYVVFQDDGIILKESLDDIIGKGPIEIDLGDLDEGTRIWVLLGHGEETVFGDWDFYQSYFTVGGEEEDDEEGGTSIFVDLTKDYSTDADGEFITVYAKDGTGYHVAVFSCNRMFFDKNLTDFENMTLVEDDEEFEGWWKYTISLRDVDFFNGLDEVDKVRIGVYKIEEDYRWIDAEKDYIVLFNDDSTFSLLEVLNIRMFYGNLTSGETADGMISFATDDFINIEIPGSVDVHEMNVAVDYGGETRTYSLTDFKVNGPDPEDEEFDGYTYYMELTDDIKDLIRQHENETITYNFTYEFKGKTVSASFKRILKGEILHQVVSISDLYNLFDFNIADEILVDSEDEAVRLFCFDSNWHMAHNDWGGGYFKVYMNDTLVESFGLGDLVHPAPAYISLSVSDLGIDASGTYNIKITHLPNPEIDIYEDDETGEIIVRPCYILVEENVLISKDIVVNFGGLENSTIEIDDIEFNYGESGSANVTLDGASDIIANVIGHDEATVTFANGKVTVSGLDAGEYTLNITTVPEEGYIAASKLINITVNKVDSAISVGDLAFDYGANASTTVDLTGATGVTAKIVNSTVVPVVDGNKVTVSGLDAGTYTLEVTSVPDANHNAVTETAKITVNKVDSAVNVSDIVFYFGDSNYVDVVLVGATGVTAKIINGTVAPVVNGTKITVSGLDAGTYTLEVTTVPDANHNAVTGTASITVGKVDSSVDISDVEFDYGDSGFVDVFLTDATGFSAKFVNSSVVPVINGNKINISGLDAGIYTLEVTTLVDGNHNPNTDTAIITINKVDSGVSVDDLVFDYDTIASTVVNVTGASGVTAKIVNSSVVPVVDGNKVTVSGLNAGTYTLEVTTVPDANHNAVTETATITVNKVDSSVNVSDIVFYFGDSNYADVILVGATGVTAKIINSTVAPVVDGNKVTVSGLDAGTYTLEVTTIPDANHNAVTGTATVSVGKIDSSVDISDVEFDYGDSGFVDVFLGGATGFTAKFVNSSVVPVINGNKINISGLDAGVYTLEVTTLVDANHNPDKNTAIITINKVDSSVSVGDLAFDYGANASTTVDLTGASGVTAKIINSTVKPAVDGNKVTVSGLDAGTYTLELTSVPDGNHNAVTGTAKITVNKVDSSVSVSNISFDYGANASTTVDFTGATGVTAKIVGSTVKPVVNGNNILISGLDAGNYTLEVTTVPDANHNAVTGTATVTVNKVEPSKIDTVIVVNTAFSRYATDFYSDGTKDGVNGERGDFFYATLYDVNGNPLANKTVQIAINGPIYNVTTDENGQAGLRVNLGKANTYTYALYFPGDEGYSASLIASSKLTVVEKPTSIIANSQYAFKPATKTKTVTVALNTIKNPYDNKLYLKVGKKLTLTVNGVTYSAKTDSKGVAKFNIKLTKAGTYKATVKFAGDSTYGSSSKSISISISKSAKSNAALKGVGVGTAPKKLADPGALNIEGNYADYVANSNISTGNVDPAKKAAVIVVDKEFTRNATDFSGGERGGFFYAKLTDSNGNPLANKTVQIAVNGPIYNVTTDKDGKAGLRVNLAKANTYTYALSFAGDDDYCPAMIASSKLTVIKKPITIDVKGLSFKASAKTKTVTVTLNTIKNEFDGKTYLKDGKTVTVKVNGITYSGSIKNGVVKFNVKLTKKGTYVAAVSFAGDSTYEPASQKVKIKIT